jgi:pimeloyl-ACP methyl ester carboxylesterase
MGPDPLMDRKLEAAQSALLERYAPETRVRRVRWSQGETQVLEVGDGLPLLLVHGGLDNAFSWAPILHELARDRHVIAVDLPGHGLADPFDFSQTDLFAHAGTFLGDVLDALELPAVELVASSIGALYAIAFAADAPQRVSRLVLAGSPAGLMRPGVPFQLRLLGLPLVGQPLGRLLMSKPTRDGNRKFWGQILVTHPERLDDTLLDADVASQIRNADSHLSLIKCIADVGGLRRKWLLGTRWQGLTMPVLVLWGEDDAFLALDKGEAVVLQNPQARVVRVPDAGHVPWHDDPKRVVNEIQSFLSTPR